MTDRAYMGEVLIKEISELLHKQMNAQKESLKKTSREFEKNVRSQAPGVR